MNTATLSHPTVRTVALDHQRLLVITRRPDARIKVLSGRVWLTEEGLAGDQFASAGEELRVAGHGRVVVEGLGCARVRLVEPRRGWAARMAALRSALSRISGHLANRPVALTLSLVLAIGLPELLGRGL
jgi:hypothetical protein